MWGQLSSLGEKISQQAANLNLDEQLVGFCFPDRSAGTDSADALAMQRSSPTLLETACLIILLPVIEL